MEVKLVVANGKHAGREIAVSGQKFFIGRAEDCHLRPSSDLVSRHHCVVLIEDQLVTVRDFGSKNGTFVNGEQVMPERELKSGDRLSIGQLQFDVRITGQKAAEPKTKQKLDDADLDISQWFGDGDASAATETQVAGGTIIKQGSTDDTVQTEIAKDAEPDDDDDDISDVSETDKEQQRRSGKMVGVSESRQQKLSSATTQEAAADMLKKLFDGRR